MLPFQQAVRLGFAAATLAAVAACSGSSESHEPEGEEEHHHAHAAVFGGTLVELGDHFANLEFACDTETGEVELYTWDAHVQSDQRSSTEAISLSITPHHHGEGDAPEPFTMTLAPRVTKTGGETVGDSSKFTGQHDSLKGLDHFGVVVAEVSLKGETFKEVEFLHPSDAHGHDHDGEEGHEDHDAEDHDAEDHDAGEHGGENG